MLHFRKMNLYRSSHARLRILPFSGTCRLHGRYDFGRALTLTKLWSAILLLLVVVIPASCAVAQSGPPAWKWQAGDSYLLKLSHNFKQKMMFGGQTNEIPCDLDLQLAWSVGSVAENGTAKIRQSIKQIDLAMKVPNIGEINFDSDAAQTETSEMNLQLPPFLDLLNERVDLLTISSRGEVIDVLFDSATVDSVAESGNTDEIVTSTMVTNLIKFLLPVLPDVESADGSAWSYDWDCEMPSGQLIVDASYKSLKSEQRNGRNVEKCAQEVTLEYANAIGSEANVKIVRQLISGVVSIDRELGMVSESSLAHEIFLEVPIAGGTVEQQFTGKLLLQIEKLGGAVR